MHMTVVRQMDVDDGFEGGFAGPVHGRHSNSERGTPDWRMIDISVPARNSRWSGTGTVTVPSASDFCITTWLPRRLTSAKPWDARIRHTSRPRKRAV